MGHLSSLCFLPSLPGLAPSAGLGRWSTPMRTWIWRLKLQQELALEEKFKLRPFDSRTSVLSTFPRQRRPSLPLASYVTVLKSLNVLVFSSMIQERGLIHMLPPLQGNLKIKLDQSCWKHLKKLEVLSKHKEALLVQYSAELCFAT